MEDLSSIQPLNYDVVAEKEGLRGVKLQRYIKYMRVLWSLSEQTKCKTGFASEWARIFLHGFEWSLADERGKVVLSRIYQEEEGQVTNGCSFSSGDNR